ncbi:MAG: tocopherol cyclase family protein [Desulfomonilia bacterium]|uniref:Tocopherol cyclase n=1 Tax=anaerobic digester metagenome TaxID=1263854 RepID=A0A485M0Z8_9ZZZZ|nr:tocopherol cyclase family protein [Pseudomonadota bacterium]HPD22285.1 tocopherol cyclase family protein [Deltaproteobacteria bacterium]HPX19366.1 tocopherol cyclase family protein [Deltaproteobacteria bacterium]HRS57137.1 tocopherol cyclase family protein [Desulfomonilia bacterium]
MALFSLWRPAVFQGNLRKSGYFEGWYFKNVSCDERTACAVIAGVSLPREREKAHAFIQFSRAGEGRSSFFRYPLSEFSADRKTFAITIGSSRFSLQGLHLDIDQDGEMLRAELEFRGIHPWPVTWLSPGAMGWYAFVPGMECYHGVLSFNHAIHGWFEKDGRRTDYSGGKGYIEKDWGRSMPGSWIWMQSNHFDEPTASFSGSIAKIPWFGRYFTGYLFGFYFQGKVYRFTTYTGARVFDLRVNRDLVSFVVEDADSRMEVRGTRAEGARLMAPSRGDMTVRIMETLGSRIELRFSRKKDNRIIYEGTGRNAGLEYVGDVRELADRLA